MQAITPDVLESITDYDPNGGITGEGVQQTFTTDASGNLGITVQGISPQGSQFNFDFLVTGMQLVHNLPYNLVPASFFTRYGCDVFFRGRKHLHDCNAAGTGEIRLNELTAEGQTHRGTLQLKSWQDLWFFNFSIFRPSHDMAVAASARAITKHEATIKAHVTFAHASARCVHSAYSQVGNSDLLFSDLPCTCPICAVTKSESPSLRKFERHFQTPAIPMTEVSGNYWTPTDPRLAEAMNILREMDTDADSNPIHRDPTSSSPHRVRIGAPRRSTAPGTTRQISKRCSGASH